MNKKTMCMQFFILWITVNCFAQSKDEFKIPDRKAIIFKHLSAQPGNTKKTGNQLNKPTGEGQRLIRTLAQNGPLGGPYNTNHEILYNYSGMRRTRTPLHGVYPVSFFDNAHSLNNNTYAAQLFNATGDLQKSIWYYDQSFSMGPGAGVYYVKQYDDLNRLILDSANQVASPNNGQNLALVTQYGYDASGRQIYYSDALTVLDPVGGGYSYSAWTYYNPGDSLPKSDSIIDFDITAQNIITTKYANHYYDASGRLINDSIFVYGANGQRSLKERSDYTYPFQGCRQEIIYLLSPTGWVPQYKRVVVKDDFGRITNNEGEIYENGNWNKYYKNTFEFTFDSQPDSLPTVFNVYNNNNVNWILDSRQVRTFNDNQMVDTLYSYYYGTGSSGYNFVAYSYNDFNNLTQAYKHYFLDNGSEINGYYTNYYYEDAPLAISEPIQSGNSIIVYPNPCLGSISLKISDDKNKEWGYVIYNATGQLCKRGNSSIGLPLDIVDLPNGNYSMAVFNKDHKQIGVAGFVKLANK